MDYIDKLNVIRARFVNRKLNFDDENDNNNNINDNSNKSNKNAKKVNHGNTKLPFGLCNKYGIEIGDNWTPRDAWEALKGKGITPDEEYKKLEEKPDDAKGEESANNNEEMSNDRLQEILDYVQGINKSDIVNKNDSFRDLLESLGKDDGIRITTHYQGGMEIYKDGSTYEIEFDYENQKFEDVSDAMEMISEAINACGMVKIEPASKNGIVFATAKSNFSDSDRDNAHWGKEFDADFWEHYVDENKKYAKKHFTKTYRGINSEQEDAIYSYTFSSYINGSLVKGHTNDYAEKITKALSGCTCDENFWVRSGWNMDKFVGIFGCEPEDVTGGEEAINKAFCSCGFNKGSGFSDKPIIANLYCPKGTEGMYIAPMSAHRYENEYLMQRGAKLRIIKAQVKNGQYYIDIEVLGHEY